MATDRVIPVSIDHRLRATRLPPEVKQELMQRLKILNPKWLDNHRLGRWNGRTKRELRYYRAAGPNGLFLPRGYLRQLILLCRRHGLGVELTDRRRLLDPLTLRFSGRLRPFQDKAVAAMAAKDFGILCAPTGSGKTVMALALIARRRQPALIVVHTKELAHQWIQRAATFLDLPADRIGLLGAGRRRLGEQVTVALVQSLYKRAPTVAPRIGFLVVDECHRCPSRTFTEAVSAFDARYMLGLSATPYRRDNLSKLIFWYLGDLHHQVAHEQLVATGDVLSAEVIQRETAFLPVSDPVTEYSRMLSELTADDDRNRLISGDVATEAERGEGVCLVLSDRKKHCEALQALLRYRHGLGSGLLTGDLSTAERRAVLASIQEGQSKVLIATGQLIGEGFDCPDLSTLFLATPIRFSGRLLQYLGRVLRPAPGKTRARVFDYVDAQVPVLQAAARARQRVYAR
jgi:superfamily II DNA or RNA helicase